MAPTKTDQAFEALLKEAEFIRSEALLCIENVRRLALYATYIAGFSLPIIAGFLNAKDGSIKTLPALMEALDKHVLVIQFICLGVSLICFAFLMIYMGHFLQIFTFARYFRDHLTPAFNKLCPTKNIELFHWENWLKAHRKKRSLFIGDINLAAEPFLIGVYSLTYGAVFLVLGLNGPIPVTSIVIAVLILLLLFGQAINYARALRDAKK